ncbi:response regulator transcription factor [Kribbella solani]|uniref:DNA-binding response OmpR family regulator n=1 Tax=Kribbella solani TaxID=236067 RepID=A0A841DTT6_9ACTN|nr:response regulator transcription factor [Kribbella solani]MBB5981992.1 DNA-binding response OmpR family regulator [Kribbella solani]MDX3001224.1 response regulator transcription factor [Kribbella solani]
MPARILVAEDDLKQADLIRRYLEREGHLTVVVHDGRAAIDEARRRSPDLLVLDVMMPKVDGLDVCRVLRADASNGAGLPIIMLTARSTEDDLLLGLDLGADDYLTKPYNPRELVARVRTVLRRTRVRGEGEVYRVGALEIDPGRHEVRVAGELIDLTPAEFKILACLAASPGRAFSRQQLLEHAFGFDHYVFDRTVDVHMMNLRKKIEPSPGEPAYLKTVYGVGYKLADKLAADHAS